MSGWSSTAKKITDQELLAGKSEYEIAVELVKHGIAMLEAQFRVVNRRSKLIKVGKLTLVPPEQARQVEQATPEVKAKAPRAPVGRKPKPRVLREWYHSNRCAQKKDKCICGVAAKLRESLSVGTILKTAEWWGSTVEAVEHKGRSANKITHPNGATMILWSDIEAA